MKALPTPKEIVAEALEKGWIKRGPNWQFSPQSWRDADIVPPPKEPSRGQLERFEQIKKRVAEYFGVDVRWIDYPQRGPEKAAVARNVAMFLCLELTPKPTTSEVAYSFRRDRTSLTHCHKCVERHIEPSELETIRQMLRN
jgi:chromosomal replication initiation ATPase DnaA